MTDPSCRHTEGPQHDCDYVEQRNAKVHIALRKSRGAEGLIKDSNCFAVESVVAGEAMRIFSDVMNDLMRTPNWNCRGTTRYLCCVPKEAHRFFAGPIAGAA